MNSPLLNRSLADLACSLPGATAVFHEQKLDFCCGGERTLQQAAVSRGLDPELLARRLELINTRATEAQDLRELPTPELIDHIVSHYHERLRVQLPELVRMARRVETVHALRPECPHGVADLLEELQQELTSHLQKEEQILFPMLVQSTHAWVQGPIGVMRLEHEQHRDVLERMAHLAHGLVTPERACNTWRALILGLQTLYEELSRHIHIENNILFARVPAPATGGCGGGGRCGCAA